MAQHASALKAERQSINRRARNRSSLSLMKTHLKKLREAITKGDTDTASKTLSETIGQIDKAAKKGVIHDNAAGRYKSRLTKKVNALSAKKA